MTFPVHVGPSSITTNRDDRILICQPDGRITGQADGFFTRDTRFISGYDLWINGTRPILLGSGRSSLLVALRVHERRAGRPRRRHRAPDRSGCVSTARSPMASTRTTTS